MFNITLEMPTFQMNDITCPYNTCDSTCSTHQVLTCIFANAFVLTEEFIVCVHLTYNNEYII